MMHGQTKIKFIVHSVLRNSCCPRADQISPKLPNHVRGRTGLLDTTGN